jgi:hypothetical protein
MATIVVPHMVCCLDPLLSNLIEWLIWKDQQINNVGEWWSPLQWPPLLCPTWSAAWIHYCPTSLSGWFERINKSIKLESGGARYNGHHCCATWSAAWIHYCPTSLSGWFERINKSIKLESGGAMYEKKKEDMRLILKCLIPNITTLALTVFK